MAYIDNEYGTQLEQALRGLVSRPYLGQPWWGWSASEIPAGVLVFDAATHSRTLYADFWKYLRDKNLVITEEEWQATYATQGWCPKYSDGDGLTTFRMPSPPLYLHGASKSDVGSYQSAGLPNIEGVAYASMTQGILLNDGVGAFYGYSTGRSTNVPSVGGNFSGNDTWAFAASRSNPIYGNSDTVTPETSKILFGVWAISAPQLPIPDATAEGIISSINTLNSKTEGVVKSVNGVNADASGNVGDVAASGIGYIRFTNGLQICQGHTGSDGNGTLTTFPAAFVDDVWDISLAYSNVIPVSGVKPLTFDSKTTSSCKVYGAGWGVSYIVIGRWKV